MKTLLKFAMGAAVAGTLVTLAMKRTGQSMNAAADASASADGPLETLEDSAGTAASASETLPPGNGDARTTGF
jgi:hypothetical protein